MIFRSGRRKRRLRRWPSRKSMLSERSCASSMMTVSYSRSSGSPCTSASSMPSVRNLITVADEVRSSKRTLLPTSRPQLTPSSSATRRAMESAATRRGCVQAMRPWTPRPAARHIFGICVVLPEPVSPARITTWCSWMVATISSARTLIGSAGGNSMRKGKGLGSDTGLVSHRTKSGCGRQGDRGSGRPGDVGIYPATPSPCLPRSLSCPLRAPPSPRS